jgi:hypothetical protein
MSHGGRHFPVFVCLPRHLGWAVTSPGIWAGLIGTVTGLLTRPPGNSLAQQLKAGVHVWPMVPVLEAAGWALFSIV